MRSSLQSRTGSITLQNALGLRQVSSLTAAITFAYGGFMTAQLGHAPMIAVAAWLPAILAALYKARQGSIAWTVVSALGLTLGILAGHPQVLLYILTVAVAYLLFLAWTERPTPETAIPKENGDAIVAPSDDHRVANGSIIVEWRRRIANPMARYWIGALSRLMLMLGIAIGLSAPLLLPAEQLSRHSVRSVINYDEAVQFGVEPVALLQLILPKVFGDDPTNFWGPFQSTEVWGYAGVITLILAVIGLARRGQAEKYHKLFFAGVAVFALLVSFARFTPLHGWLYGLIPGYSRVRAAGRLLVLYDFAVAILAAWGMDTILTWFASRDPFSDGLDTILRRVRYGLIAAITGLVLFVIPFFYGIILFHEERHDRPLIAVNGINFLLILLLGALLLVWVAERRKVSKSTISSLAVGLVILDIFSATIGFNPTTDDLGATLRQHDARNELRQRMATEPPFRLDTDDVADRWQPSLVLLDGADSISGMFNPLQLADYARLRELAQSSRTSALYSLLNVGYVGFPSDKPPSGDWPRAFVGRGVTFYKPVRPSLPRAFVVGSAETVGSSGAAFDRMKAKGFDPTKVIYIQGSSQPVTADPEASAAEVTYDGTDGVTVRVTTQGAGYLLLTDAYYPGWQATVDGAATTILQTDVAFRSVYLPGGGNHTVAFRYRPKWWTFGWGIAGLTSLGTVALLVLPHIVRRRRRADCDEVSR